MPFGNRKNILEDLFSSVLSQFEKYQPTWKPEINLFRHFPKLKIACSMGGKILSISLRLNFTPNSMG